MVKVYLVAHTNEKDSGVAQCKILAKNESAARLKFSERYPGRKLQAIADRDRDR